jgi:transcriptional regulator with XRE-family HTH domain
MIASQVHLSQQVYSSMQPEQMRAARAALNWSLDDLATASGVHRNTLSNFETRKYEGEPQKLAAIQQTLEAAGVIFIEENGQAAGVRLRRFQVGDLVRFRPETRVRFNYNIPAHEVGTVVEVEQHPPQTGPTYRMMVKFPSYEHALPYVFRFEYQLVQAAALTDEEIALLRQLNQEERTISGNKPRKGLDRLVSVGYVTVRSLNVSATLYSITDAGRAILAQSRMGP